MLRSRFAVVAVLILLAALAPLPAFADPNPGDACTPNGLFTRTGGAESSGVGNMMVCSGGTWKAQIGFDGTANVALNYAVSLTGDLTPAQITSNQNNYNPAGLATASVLRLNTSASRNITGLAGGGDGRILTIINIGSNPIVLKNDDGATSTAANRFALNADVSLASKQAVALIYDSTTQRWRSVGLGGGGAGDNLGNHTATQNIELGSHYLSGNGNDEGITVSATGKVSIGTADATHTLTIGGDGIQLGDRPTPLDASDSAYSDVGNNIFFTQNGVSEDFIGYKNNTFYFADAGGGGSDVAPPDVVMLGNVGIGTTSPGYKLEVSGTMRAHLDAGTYFNMENWGGYDISATNGFTFNSIDNNGYEFRTGGTTRLAIDQVGNVGIGTTNPYVPLQVSGDGFNMGDNHAVISATNPAGDKITYLGFDSTGDIGMTGRHTSQ